MKINDLVTFNPSKVAVRNIPDDMLVSFVEMASVSNNGYIETMQDKSLGDLRKGSYTYFAENDILIAKITPCMENGKCAIATGLTNGIGMGSSEFHVLRVNEKVNNRFLFNYLNRDEIRKAAASQMTGASGHRRVPVSYYEQLEIALPPLSRQQAIATEIESYEKEIAAARKVMDGCAARKQQILRKWLG